MKRTQLRCFVASICLHTLLVSVLFVGPAFLPSKPPPPQELLNELAILDFAPLKTTDEMISGGGNPNAKPPKSEEQPKVDPTQPAPKPKPPPKVELPPPKETKPEPKRMLEPEPEKNAPPPSRINPDSIEPVEKKPRLPDVSTKIVTRKNTKAIEAWERVRKEAAERARQQQEAYEARQRLASSLARAANNIAEGLSSTTTIELRGPGGGGVPYANFLLAVKSRYTHAWIVPDGVTDDRAIAEVTVKIARDGRVLDARITKPSGNAAVDRSIEDTLARVRFAAPLPEGAKEDHRTVSISFNVKAKRSTG